LGNTMIWTDAQKDLDIQLQMEREQFLQPEKDRVKVFKMLASSYIKYMRIFRNLEEAHDGLVHQQKRAAIRQVLDGVIGRILEMKKEMVALENSEFHYIDNILEDLKLLPEDIEIPIPRYFIKENLEVLQQREKMLDEILCEAGLQTQIPVKAMTFEEAVKMIQVAERARQGRRRAVFMKQMYLEEKRKRQTKLQVQTGPNPDDAATCIQKVWRGYIQRKKTEKMREEEMIFLGMVSDALHAKQINAQQGEVHERNEEVFIKDKLRETEGLDIKETLEDQIRPMFHRVHIIGRFPDYPTKEAGGSATIFSEKTPEQVLCLRLAFFFFLCLQKQLEKSMASITFFPLSSFFWITAVWQNRDEGWDLLQDHDLELIKEEKREEDTNNVSPFRFLGATFHNYIALVESPSLDRAGFAESMQYWYSVVVFHYLSYAFYNNAVSHLLSPCFLPTGEYSYLGTTLRQVDIEPVPSLADVRQLIALYGILPLGSQTVHEKAPLVKALLLAGPAGVGKKMLVDAICTETGANLFNLSASNIAGKYPGKSGLQMMLHMVLKVAKQLQPSVVWIGETEKTFYKSVPKISPKRLEKILPKFLKALKAQDRVLLVGTTRRPFDANLKPFCKVYQKIIMIPRPDYASRFAVLWKHIIQQNGGVITNLLNISCLAKVSDGFTQGHIVQVVRAVLSELRLLQMPRKPLRTAEEEEETFKVTLRAMLTGRDLGHLGSSGCST
uniref:IQ motif containing with AAA domain 1 n=1 Tax=Anas platyrhynchos TaxID=8839 RepID=A0A8B9ZLE5_ANAPL